MSLAFCVTIICFQNSFRHTRQGPFTFVRTNRIPSGLNCVASNVQNFATSLLIYLGTWPAIRSHVLFPLPCSPLLAQQFCYVFVPCILWSVPFIFFSDLASHSLFTWRWLFILHKCPNHLNFCSPFFSNGSFAPNCRLILVFRILPILLAPALLVNCLYTVRLVFI